MLRLTRADVDAFAAASGDHNPLHVAPEYARSSAFGQAIAHGVLGLCRALAGLPERPGQRLARIAVEFPRPVLLDTDYEVELRADGPDGDAATLEVRDGSKPALRGRLEWVARSAGEAPAGDDRAGDADDAPGELGLREVAARRTDWTRGEQVEGRYRPIPEAEEQHSLAAVGIDAATLAVLRLSSYVVGMELPGEHALFTRLALEFGPRQLAADPGPLRWTARVDGWQPRTGALRIGLEVRVADEVWATGSLRAFVRAAEQSESPDVDARSSELDPQVFAGQTAVILGASRGLGRSLARAFVAHGGRVVAVSRSPIDGDALLAGVPSTQPDSVQTIIADASDPAELGPALDALARIDVLVCNAAPPLQPWTLEPATAARVLAHIHQATALVATGLALALPRLAASRGAALLCSSEAVSSPPAEWAHYVAGKRAGEGLFEVAALQYPEVALLIARLPRLATGYSLNVSGEPAAPTHEIALSLIEAIARARSEAGDEPHRAEQISFDRA